MGRRNKKRGNIAPFIKLDMWVQNTLAWRDLGPVARALYIELRARYNGTNNGFIGLGAREAGKALNVSKDTAQRAFVSLSDHGFIRLATPSSFNTNGRKAAEWLLTEDRDDRTGRLPTREFKEWRPGGKTNRSPRNETLSPRNETQAPPETRCVSGQGRNAPLTDELAYQDGVTYRSTTGWRAANG